MKSSHVSKLLLQCLPLNVGLNLTSLVSWSFTDTAHLSPPDDCPRLQFQIIIILFYFINRRRSCSFAEYWKHFMARFNDVHASGYNSAGSERIWMKFGELRLYCPYRFRARSAHKRQRESEPKFCFFCHVNNARLYRFPVSQISRNLHTRSGSERW